MKLSALDRDRFYSLARHRKPMKRNISLVPTIMAMGFSPDYASYYYPNWYSKFYFHRPSSRQDAGGRYRWERHIRLANGEWHHPDTHSARKANEQV